MMEYCSYNGKQCFMSRNDALKASRNMLERNRGEASVYFCNHCNHWHLTHYSYKRSKALRDRFRFYEDIIPQKRKRKKENDMRIICDSEIKTDSFILEIDKRDDKHDKLKVTAFARGDELVLYLSFDQAQELVEAIKIQTAKLL